MILNYDFVLVYTALEKVESIVNLFWFLGFWIFLSRGIYSNYYLLSIWGMRIFAYFWVMDKVDCLFRMATAFQQAICSNQLHRYSDSSSSCKKSRNFTMISKLYSSGTSKILLKKAKCRYNCSKVFAVCASVSDSILSSLDTSGHDSRKMTGKFNLEFVFICKWYPKAKWSDQNFNI